MKNNFYTLFEKIYNTLFPKTLYIGKTPVLKTRGYKKSTYCDDRTFLDKKTQERRVYLLKDNSRNSTLDVFSRKKTTEVDNFNDLKDYFFDDVVYTVKYRKNQITSIHGYSATLMWQGEEKNKTRGVIKPATTYYRNGRVYKEVFVSPVYYNKDAWNVSDVYYCGSYPTCLYYHDNGEIDEERSCFHFFDDNNPILKLFNKKTNINPVACLDCDLEGGCKMKRIHMYGTETKFDCTDRTFISYRELKIFLAGCSIDVDNWRNFTLSDKIIIHLLINAYKYKDLLSMAYICYNDDKLKVSKEQLSLLEILLIDNKFSIR